MFSMTRSVAMRTAGAVALAAASIALVASPTPALAKKEKAAKPAKGGGLTPSKEFLLIAVELQKASTAKDAAALEAGIAKGTPLATTPDDKYLLGSAINQLSILKGDGIMQTKGLGMMLDSGKVAAVDQPKFQMVVGKGAFVDKDYARALTLLNAAKSAGLVDPLLDRMIVESLFATNQNDQAIAAAKAAVAADRAANRKPSEGVFIAPAQYLLKANRKTEALDWLIMRSEFYSDPKAWQNLVLVYLQSTPNDKDMTLDALRLLRASNAMTSRTEYVEHAALASELGLPGEAVAVINEARARGIAKAGDKFFDEIFARQNPQIAADRAAIARDKASASTFPNGLRAKSTGDASFAYGDYATAQQMYELALSKGKVDTGMIQTRLGMALLMQGKAAEAKATFDKITGPRAHLARIWSVYAQQKMAGNAS